MSVNRCYFTLFLLWAACSLLAGVVQAQAESPQRVPSLRSGGQPLVLEDENGWVVLHFISVPADESIQDYVSQIVRDGPELAGVRQVVLLSGVEDEVKILAGQVPPEFIYVYYDTDEALSQRFKIKKSPSTILLGPGLEEIYRHESRESGDFLPQRSLAAQVQRRWRNPGVDIFTKQGKALGGYDPVAYFTERKAVRGKPHLRSNYRGSVYLFSTPEHRRLFADDPEKYLPEFGGWDATAMAEDGRVEPDPTNFLLNGGKLYLFYRGVWGDSRETWIKNETELMGKANATWDRITGKEIE